jgi:hypothetical protein
VAGGKERSRAASVQGGGAGGDIRIAELEAVINRLQEELTAKTAAHKQNAEKDRVSAKSEMDGLRAEIATLKQEAAREVTPPELTAEEQRLKVIKAEIVGKNNALVDASRAAKGKLLREIEALTEQLKPKPSWQEYEGIIDGMREEMVTTEAASEARVVEVGAELAQQTNLTARLTFENRDLAKKLQVTCLSDFEGLGEGIADSSVSKMQVNPQPKSAKFCFGKPCWST